MASGPVTAIQSAVLDGFGEMRHREVLCAFEIGDGARHFEDAVVGARRESLLLHGAFQQALGVGTQARSKRESGGWSSARWR